MCEWVDKALCRPGVSKLIKQIPNYHTRITRLNSHQSRCRVNHVTEWSQMWKRRTPPCHVGKAEGLASSLPSPKVVCPTILLEWLEDSFLSIIRLFPYLEHGKEQWLSAFFTWANNYHQDAQMSVMHMLQKAAVVLIPMFESLLVNTASSMVSESRKHTPEQA